MSAVSESYACASGGVISGGRFHRPAWRRAMAKYQFSLINSSDTFQSIDPAQNPLLNPNYPDRAPWALMANGGPSNFASMDGVMVPWCHGAYDDVLGEFWLANGGGHGDSANNGVYKQKLHTDNPYCSIVRPPSGSLPLIAGGIPAGATPQVNSYKLDDGLESSGVYADGRLRAAHSYRSYVFVQGVGIVFCRPAGLFAAGTPTTKSVWLLDCSTGEWELKSEASPAGIGSSIDGAACYDSTRGVVIYRGSGTAAFMRLSLSTWQYSALGSTDAESGSQSIFYAPEYDVIVEINSFFTSKIQVVDASTGAKTRPSAIGTVPSVIGATGADWVTGYGMVFDMDGTMWCAAPTGNPKTDPWEWYQLPMTGSPPALAGVRPYGKFGYSKRLGGCYRYSTGTIKPCFYALD